MTINGTVTVRLKHGVLDPEGQTIQRALVQMGFGGVTDVRTLRMFEISIDAPDPETARGRLREMSERLLANPVVETFDVEVET